MPELSVSTRKLIRQYQNLHWAAQPKEDSLTIHVDEIASKVATFYERIRKVVDWREEHLMRRVAIERILKRRLFLTAKSEDAAEPFVFELIRGGHFPNDTIEKSKTKKVQKIINKFSYVLKNCPPSPKGRNKGQLYTQMLSIAACEVEEALNPASHLKANALIAYMEEAMNAKIRIGKRALESVGGMTESEKSEQVYIAVQQALFKLDTPIITYNLIKRRYVDWTSLPEASYGRFAGEIHDILGSIEKSLEHPLADKVYKICELYDTPFLLIGDVVFENPLEAEANLCDSEFLDEAVKKMYNRRLKTLGKRTRRAAVYSTLSIFLSNVLSLYAVEIPFAKYVTGSINMFAAIFDILGPTVLMGAIVLTIRSPKKDNLVLVQEEARKNAYEEPKDGIYEVELYPKRSVIFKIIISLLYIVSFGVSYGGIIWLLSKFKFPPLSYLLLMMFTSLITYTGLKIRERARELHVTPKKETILNVFLDPFTMPVVYVGRKLSNAWKKYNIIGVAFNFLLDTPFLTFVEFLEQWRYFLKEKKEKIH